jgi:UDP-galactopyranose mutase
VTATDVVVIGAGPTGLSAAYHLGTRALLLEQHDRVGGWCRSITEGGFTFDYAGHIMFSNEPYVHQMYERLLGNNVHWQDREAWIFSKGVHTRYPFQGSLYGLPPDVIAECLLGAIEARYGTRPAHASGNGNGNGHGNGATAASPVRDCCADGVLEATAPLAPAVPPANFRDFIENVWGRGIARHFAIPYNRKLWAVPLEEMETSWLGGRVPMPDLGDMIRGALEPSARPMGPNARFGYVLHGGFQRLMDGFLPLLEGPLRLNARVTGISLRGKRLRLDDGEEVRFDHVISTMPLPVLIRLLGREAPDDVVEAASGLRHVSVRCVHLGIGRERLTDKHWIYYPEDPVFHRIFVQGNASPHCNPPGGFGLTCEITYSPQKPLPCDGDALVARCLEDCRRVGLVREDDPLWAAAQVDLPYAYVVYDHERADRVRLIRSWLADHGVTLAGRYAEWEYYNSDHAFMAGKAAAESLPAPGRRRDATASAAAPARC